MGLCLCIISQKTIYYFSLLVKHLRKTGNLLCTCVFWHLIFGWSVLQVKLLHILLRFLWPPIWVKGLAASAERRCWISVTTLPDTTRGTWVLRNLCPGYSWKSSTAGSKDNSTWRGWTMCQQSCSKNRLKGGFLSSPPFLFPTIVFSCLVFLSPHAPYQPNSRQKSPETTFLVNVLWDLHPAANAGVKYF